MGRWLAWQGKTKVLPTTPRTGRRGGLFWRLDAFVDDLASGHESCDYILPELGSLFALISPTITWKDAWNRLAAHLSQFREYKRGREIEIRQDIPSGAEHVFADLLFRSVETTSVPLTQMATTAAHRNRSI